MASFTSEIFESLRENSAGAAPDSARLSSDAAYSAALCDVSRAERSLSNFA